MFISMVSVVCWLLMLMVVIHGNLLEIEDQVRIIATLKKKLLCNCVFLVATDEKTALALELQKTLNDTSAILNSHSLESAYCRELSLYVLLDITFYNQETHTVFLKTCATSVWVVYSTSLEQQNMFSKLHVPFDSQLYVTQLSEGGEVTVWELYRVAENLPLIKYLCGNLVLGQLNWTHRNVHQRRPHLNGLTFAVAIKKNYLRDQVNRSQVNEVRPNTRGHTKRMFDNMMANVWATLKEGLNFSCNYVLMPESSTDDIVSAVKYNHVDIGLGDVSITKIRQVYVDFTVPMYSTSSKLFVRHRGYAGLNWGSFLEPFSNPLWVAVVTSIVVIAVHLQLLHIWRRRHGLTDPLTLNSFCDCLMCVFGAFCLQGHSLAPRSTSTRSVLLVAYLTAVTLMAAYAAALISHLTVRPVVMPFKDVEDCLNDGSYSFRSVEGTASMEILRKSTYPTAMRVFNLLIHPSMKEFDVLRYLGDICSSRMAVYTDIDTILSHREFLPCEIVALPGLDISTQLSFPVTKGSPYIHILNYKLRLLRESGLVYKLLGDASMSQLPVPMNLWTSVGMLEVVPILTALSVGYLLAVIILLLEVYVYRLRAKIQPSTQFISSDGLQRF